MVGGTLGGGAEGSVPGGGGKEDLAEGRVGGAPNTFFIVFGTRLLLVVILLF